MNLVEDVFRSKTRDHYRLEERGRPRPGSAAAKLQARAEGVKFAEAG